MSGGRERYDRQIEAHELKVGDSLHLTFMGGDDFVEVTNVRELGEEDDHWIAWEGSSVGGDLKDEIPWGTKVWVKK